MRSLVVHIGEGSTHILLATTSKEELRTSRRTGTPFSFTMTETELKASNQMFVMHDQHIRNGADLSLYYLDHLTPDLRENMLLQASEALHHFQNLTDSLTISISESLLPDPKSPERDPLIRDFQNRHAVKLQILSPLDESLWMLRGVRGLQPSGELACATTGYWRCLMAVEVPGLAPRFHNWEEGASRFPSERDLKNRLFTSVEPLAEEMPFYLAGEHAWILAAQKIGLTFHDMALLNETRLSVGDLIELEHFLGTMTARERNMIPMINGSGESILEGLVLIRRLLQRLGVHEARVSSRGVAHGLISHLFFEGRSRKA